MKEMSVKTQKGMTLIGMLMSAICVIFIGVVVMKIVPVYIQHYSVVSSVKALDTLPKEDLTGPPASTVIFLRKKLSNQLYINGIEDVTKDHVKISPGRNGFEVSVKYNVKRHLFSNLYLYFEFDDSVKVSRAK
jgi:Domain of unknown function (DUF4845)